MNTESRKGGRLDRGAIPSDQYNRLLPTVKGQTHVDGKITSLFPGTCEACIYGRGQHVETCTSLQKFAQNTLDAPIRNEIRDRKTSVPNCNCTQCRKLREKENEPKEEA